MPLRILAQAHRGPDDCKGGDVIFQVGIGTVPGERLPHGKHGSFRWKLGDGTEIMRIDEDGKFTIRGEAVCNKEIYKAFSSWISTAKVSHEKGDCYIVAGKEASDD